MRDIDECTLINAYHVCNVLHASELVEAEDQFGQCRERCGQFKLGQTIVVKTKCVHLCQAADIGSLKDNTLTQLGEPGIGGGGGGWGTEAEQG